VILYTDENRKDYYSSNCPSENILMVKMDPYNNEDAVRVLHEILREDCIVFPPNIFGKEMCVRLGYRFDGVSLSGVESMNGDKFTKKVYSGYMNGEFSLVKKPIMISFGRYRPKGSNRRGYKYDFTLYIIV